MDHEKIERINELARKKKSGELTAEEAAEQRMLRAEYIAEFRENTRVVLERVVIVEQDGTQRKLEKKKSTEYRSTIIEPK